MGTRRVSAKARREDGGVKVLGAIFLICEEVVFMHEIDAFPLHSNAVLEPGWNSIPSIKATLFSFIFCANDDSCSMVNERASFDSIESSLGYLKGNNALSHLC